MLSGEYRASCQLPDVFGHSALEEAVRVLRVEAPELVPLIERVLRQPPMLLSARKLRQSAQRAAPQHSQGIMQGWLTLGPTTLFGLNTVGSDATSTYPKLSTKTGPWIEIQVFRSAIVHLRGHHTSHMRRWGTTCRVRLIFLALVPLSAKADIRFVKDLDFNPGTI